jgi:RNA 2',3'-cyclic 3'-phosphodiesterase
MPRLFTAIEIPKEIGDDLAMLRGGLPGARWIDPENYHLTLRFIGDIDDALASDIALLLEGISRVPFELQLDGISAFGGNKPRAIIATVEPTRALMELQAEQESIMKRMRVPSDSRKFTPHVTLARLRDVRPHEVAEYLATRLYRSAPFRVSQFVLYSSRASMGGGPYVVEAAYPLAG